METHLIRGNVDEATHPPKGREVDLEVSRTGSGRQSQQASDSLCLSADGERRPSGLRAGVLARPRALHLVRVVARNPLS